MKTIGIGVDLVKNSRIQLLIKNKNFINRIFGKTEILNSKKVINKTNYFSKRFAAKESLAKALGTGFRDNLNFKDIQIINDKLGKPYFLITTKIKNLIEKKKMLKNLICFFQFLMKKNIQ